MRGMGIKVRSVIVIGSFGSRKYLFGAFRLFGRAVHEKDNASAEGMGVDQLKLGAKPVREEALTAPQHKRVKPKVVLVNQV